MPEPDRERLLDLLYWAREQDARRRAGLRSEWDQTDWIKVTSCGTACCIAGRAVLLEGWKPVDGGSSWNVVNEHGDFREVDDVARDLLGIDHNDSYSLFLADNTLEDVEEIILGILDGTFDHTTWVPHGDRVPF